MHGRAFRSAGYRYRLDPAAPDLLAGRSGGDASTRWVRMHWWVWLLAGWVLLAVAASLLLGRAMQVAEELDRVRRGRPERRARAR